ncbi:MULTISPECIES: multiple monosaccharide ABC transporter permease [Pelosinus]|uniref:Xylose transport system permease protein XylH n=1 Tax=Pelosinus fermentans B4 TaxID=1149862 RepID=I9LBN2_9FIRM|nr:MULTISPECIES: multiple monosaccharide ABC transporter permease [Pelosinus]EIW17804.1 ABC-type transporter, integral membrane subunit [Pelosinus fermentans B4]EIW23766.1 ABC-type transporter, integral membrane subunit [Pelosinus fermentans A11]OAM94689.1 ABC-type transporter, integral membrane subunit [Pelosinus fermentans DSM 17108]SDR15447.1 putative multiple sugar transport system permease protein [Pelosinus fermentans]
METLKQMFKNNIREYGMVIALVSIVIFFEIVSKGVLLQPLNVTNLIQQNSYILILAIGMLLVIVAFQIDLSVGSIAAFVGAVSAILMIDHHIGVVPGILISLLIGGLAGAFQGYWVAYFKIPGFIVTLAGMLIFRGLTMTALEGQSKAPFPEVFQKMSNGFIPDVLSGTSIHITTLVVGIILTLVYIYFELNHRKAKQEYNFEVIPVQFLAAKLVFVGVAINWFMYLLASYKGIPNVLILLFILIVFYTFITTKTVIGRHIYALGGNEKAAKLSGVKTERIVFWVFVNMGVLAALSGLVFAARLNAATPKAGTGFELDAIAACFIGGASTAGGIGVVMGAIIGGLVMGVMNNGMSLIGVTIDMQQTIKGLVLLLAVAFDIYTKSKQS